MDDGHAQLQMLQQEVQDRIAGIGQRLNAASGPIHPADLHDDVRALHDAFARLKAKADVLTRSS